jgi:hypothetical protein
MRINTTRVAEMGTPAAVKGAAAGGHGGCLQRSRGRYRRSTTGHLTPRAVRSERGSHREAPEHRPLPGRLVGFARRRSMATRRGPADFDAASTTPTQPPINTRELAWPDPSGGMAGTTDVNASCTTSVRRSRPPSDDLFNLVHHPGFSPSSGNGSGTTKAHVHPVSTGWHLHPSRETPSPWYPWAGSRPSECRTFAPLPAGARRMIPKLGATNSSGSVSPPRWTAPARSASAAGVGADLRD